jgi:hypothetical protein
MALPRLRKAVADDESRERVRDRLATYMGPPRAMADLREIVTVLTIRHPLTAVAGKLPEHIETLAGETLTAARAALDEIAAGCGDAFIYPLLLVMRRMSEPWQLVRLGTRAAAGRSNTSSAPYRLAIMLVVANTEDSLSALRTALKSGDTETVSESVRAIGLALKGLGSELDLSGNSWASQKLEAIRNEVQSLLAAEIEAVPGSVRQLVETASPTTTGATDAPAVTATDRKIALVQIIRPFAGALELAGLIASVLSKLQIGLRRAIAALLGRLRGALDYARNLYVARITHAVRICARLFGKDYATAVVAASEAAPEDEHPMAS